MLENLDPGSVKAGFEALRSVLDTYKSLRDNFKKQPELHEQLSTEIAQAEREVQLAEAQLALALGHRLCRAHFPPIPMLFDREHPKHTFDIFKCPSCGRENPSEEKIDNWEKRPTAAEIGRMYRSR